MTGKEALDNLTKGIYCPPNCNNCDKCEKNESIKVIKKDLEVLEILKRKYVDLYLIRICIEDEQPYLRYNQEIIDCLIAYDKCELLTEDEYIKIKEWLNEKTD